MRTAPPTPVLATLVSILGACSPAPPPPPVATPPPRPTAAADVACETGHADCDDDPKNGCEADLSKPESCGRCGVTCGPAESCVVDRCARVRTLAISDRSTCALHGGKVHCWGPYRYTELDADPKHDTRPRVVEGIEDAVTLHASTTNDDLLCAVRSGGSVGCYPTMPPHLQARHDIRDVATHAIGACGALRSGKVVCDREPVPDLTDATLVAANDEGFYALRRSGTVLYLGEYGDEPAELQGVVGAVDLAAFGESVCVLLDSGKVTCNRNDDDATRRRVHQRRFTEVPGLTDAVAVDVECAVRANGEAVSFHLDPTPTAPRPIPGVRDARQIACATHHGCFERKDGRVFCFGGRDLGRLGDGGETSLRPAAEVLGLTDAKAIALGPGTCALRADGTLACWGTREPRTRRGIPIERVAKIEGVTSLSTTESSACAVDGHKDVHCFLPLVEPADVETYTGLGDVTKAFAIGAFGVALRRSGDVLFFPTRSAYGGPPAPRVVLPGIRDAIDLQVGFSFVCVLRKSGRIACLNTGFLDDHEGLVKAMRNVLPVKGVQDAVSLAGDLPICFLRRSGASGCIERAVEEGKPLRLEAVASPFGARADLARIAAGNRNACAVTKTGEVVCAQFDGYSPPSTLPPAPATIKNAVDVAVSRDRACAVLATGKAVCWGDNSGDALGGGEPGVAPEPVEVRFDGAN